MILLKVSSTSSIGELEWLGSIWKMLIYSISHLPIYVYPLSLVIFGLCIEYMYLVNVMDICIWSMYSISHINCAVRFSRVNPTLIPINHCNMPIKN